ncbi:Histidine ammonia-lyase [compost metagenome]
MLAIEILVGCQALDFHEVCKASSATRALYDLVRSRVARADEDRAFYPDIVAVTEQLRSGEILATVERVLANQ